MARSRRRRRTLDDNPLNAARMWQVKMNPTVISEYVAIGRERGYEAQVEYQVQRQRLVEIAREAVSRYGESPGRVHMYVWFAQGIWYLVNKYEGPALQREADALYTYWLLLGLRDDALRFVASKLGVNISSLQEIAEKLGAALLSEQVVYEGTKKALEETIKPYLSKPDISMDKVQIQLTYDANRNITQMKITDKATGETVTLNFTYDAEGYLISIDEV